MYYKYIMKNSSDYRTGINNDESHGVLLVDFIDNSDGTQTLIAYGEFGMIDKDMAVVSDLTRITELDLIKTGHKRI